MPSITSDDQFRELQEFLKEKDSKWREAMSTKKTTLDKKAINREGDARWRDWRPSPENGLRRPSKTEFRKQVRTEMEARASAETGRFTSETPNVENVERPNLTESSKTKRLKRVIHRVTLNNPRRPGSDAHKYYEEMVEGRTVQEYLDKFPDKTKAAQWIWNTARDGHVELKEPE